MANRRAAVELSSEKDSDYFTDISGSVAEANLIAKSKQ
jgi:hypothetical protein